MKWLLSLTFVFSFQLRAEVSPEHVESMIEQMVQKNVISRAEAEKTKARMRSLSSEQWGQINNQAASIATRSPASANVQSEVNIAEVKAIDLDSAQFNQIKSDIGKIVPHYKD
jgi:hypothetical protein